MEWWNKVGRPALAIAILGTLVQISATGYANLAELDEASPVFETVSSATSACYGLASIPYVVSITQPFIPNGDSGYTRDVQGRNYGWFIRTYIWDIEGWEVYAIAGSSGGSNCAVRSLPNGGITLAASTCAEIQDATNLGAQLQAVHAEYCSVLP